MIPTLRHRVKTLAHADTVADPSGTSWKAMK